MNKYTFAILINIACVTLVNAQASKTEIVQYLQDTYESQMNITSLPGSFYDCGYEVYMYNYSKADTVPQKTVGDQCLYPLLENNLDLIEFSDNGIKLFKIYKEQLILSCASLTPSTKGQCRCAVNYYDSQGVGYLEIVSGDFENSDMRRQAIRRCSNE